MELLVVIAIVAILIALLLPAFQGARAGASVVLSEQSHQIHLGIVMDADDHDGFLWWSFTQSVL